MSDTSRELQSEDYCRHGPHTVEKLFSALPYAQRPATSQTNFDFPSTKPVAAGNISSDSPEANMSNTLTNGIRRVAVRLVTDTTSDGELLSRYLAHHDEGAFATLVRRHAAMVSGTCRRVLGTAADADDAFQAAFLVLVRKGHSLTDQVCVGNFLYGVAFHTALKAKAMAVKRRDKEARVRHPEVARIGPTFSRQLDEELSRLPEKYREPGGAL